MLDDEGNPDIDEEEMHSATSEKENKEGGWDVSACFSFTHIQIRIEGGISIKARVLNGVFKGRHSFWLL